MIAGYNWTFLLLLILFFIMSYFQWIWTLLFYIFFAIELFDEVLNVQNEYFQAMDFIIVKGSKILLEISRELCDIVECQTCASLFGHSTIPKKLGALNFYLYLAFLPK